MARNLGAIVGITLMLASACAIHRGEGWRAKAAAPTPTSIHGVDIVVLGNADEAGPMSRVVAVELDRFFKSRSAATVIVWTGQSHTDETGCAAPTQRWSRPGLAQLATIVRECVRAGASSFSAMGTLPWTCGDPVERLQRDAAVSDPWAMPGLHYVVSVAEGGHTSLVTTCTGTNDGCRSAAPRGLSEDRLVDLVFVDVGWWFREPASGSTRVQRARQSELDLASLLTSLEHKGARSMVPRILVVHMPIETAASVGLGAGEAMASYRHFPPVLQEAIARGTFVGVLAGHARTLEAEDDLAPAIRRTAKRWMLAPVFQVVSGTAGNPNGVAGTGRTAIPYFRSMASQPELVTTHPGFATLHITRERIEVTLHARRLGRWERASLSFATLRPPLPSATPPAPMAPCLRCDPISPDTTSPWQLELRDR